MLHVFVNQGQRRLLALFLCIFLLASGAGFMLSEGLTRHFLSVQIEEKIAMIGYLEQTDLLLSPQVDHVAVSGLLDGRFDNEQLSAGRQWLAAYGFEEPDTWSFYGAYNDLRQSVIANFLLPAGLALLLMYITCVLILGSIYRQIRKIADISQQAAAEPGKINVNDMSIRNEGDLAVLWHATIHLAEKAASQLRALHHDKKYLQDFLSDISHQIKTPLASLQLYLDLMLQSHKANQEIPREKRQEFIEQGLAQISRIDWLIQGLLKMARLDAGSVQMKLVHADIQHTVEQAAGAFAVVVKKRNIVISNEIRQGLIWPHDPEWLTEAISNLLKNAIEHVPDGGRIMIRAVETPVSLQLEFSDNGPGIPTTEINRIFERFYRREASKRPDSVGIGLSLARSIFEQNGAELIAANRPGSGTGAVFTASFLKKS